MESDNILVRCPAGHELQAARADLGKLLSCPVCGQKFSPGGVGPPQARAAGRPATLSSADGTLPRPVSVPRFTVWMVVLWLVFEVASGFNAFIQMSAPANPQAANPASLLMGCFTVMVGVAAVVLQLMWIHRIHSDALRGRGYREVSPGSALGLSFIPAFNFIWTAWTMKKLARFAASGAPSENPAADEGVRAGTVCLFFGIIEALRTCVEILLGGVVAFNSFTQAGAGGPVDPLATAGPGFHVAVAVMATIGLIATIVYAWAVLKVQKSLYRFLGAAS
jgi:hypothetical protein